MCRAGTGSCTSSNSGAKDSAGTIASSDSASARTKAQEVLIAAVHDN